MRRLLPLLILLVLACRGETQSKLQARTPHLIFVGLDGADWQLLDRFIEDGTMPNLAVLVKEGRRAPLRTQHPPLSPLVWTTMMTGVSPLEHRILDFTRFNPTSHTREPISSDERAVPAIWNMASSTGRKVAVFGLWATYPAEEVRGVIVSDRLLSFQYEASPPLRAVWPEADEVRARAVLHDVVSKTGFNAVRHYVPLLTSADYASTVSGPDAFAHPLTALRRIVVETEVMHRLATTTIDRDRPDLTIVYFQGTDVIGHLFAPYFPPRLAGVTEQDFARYHDVPRRYFHRIDELLGDYRNLARRTNSTLVIASDHGFRWFEGRSTFSSVAVATAAKWHRDDGIILEVGPSTAALPATIAGICPMLLGRLGMSVDLRSYRRGYRPATAAPAGGVEEIAKLKALGYLGGGEPSSTREASTRTSASYNNEGLLLLAAGRDAEAMSAFESALRVDPNGSSAMWNLSELLRRSHGDERRAAALLDRALEIDPNEPRWFLERGRTRLEQSQCRDALADFTRATTLAPDDALAFASAGTAALCLGDERVAKASFAKSLQLDPNQPRLRQLLR